MVKIVKKYTTFENFDEERKIFSKEIFEKI
jgi:hypothetical protein